MCKRLIFFRLLVFLALACGLEGQERMICRISVENVSSHFQTRTLHRFADKVAELSGGALLVEFYDGARLYRDSDAIGALATGKVEVILPGIWQLDRFVPDTGALMLPSVFGRPRQVIRNLADGPFGEKISRSIEEAVNAVVLGPWLDLGYGQVFSQSKAIRSVSDISGKRIRVAGGKGNEERVRALGGTAVTIAWPDLPSYLSRGLVDGVLTTYETVDSGGLDEYGIRSVLEDNEYYPFYVPLVNRSFWDRLSPELKEAFTGTWAEAVTEGRVTAEKAQETAKANLVKRGLSVYVLKPEETVAVRNRLLQQEDAIAARLSISPGIVALLRAGITGKDAR